MDNRKVFAHTDKLVIGEKQSYSSSSSSSTRSAMTTASKREWSLVGKKDYATKDVPDTAVWEEPSNNAAVMEEERPAMAIDSFGYDGDDGDLPATSGSNVFSSLGQMFGEQNNDNAMDDAMDDGNVGNMPFSFKKKRRRMTNITDEWNCKKCTFTHRYHSNKCMMCFNANPDVAYSLMPTARMVSDYTNDPLGTSETTLPKVYDQSKQEGKEYNSIIL